MTELSFNLKGLSVFIAMPTRGDIPPETVIALIETIDLFRINRINCSVYMQKDGHVYQARSEAAAKFLSSDSNRLFFIDSDMVWKPDDALRLLALSTAMDIVTGPYTTRKSPVLFTIRVPDSSAIPLNEYGCMAIDGTGLGFCIIKRIVIEALSENSSLIQYSSDEPIPNIFKFGIDKSRFVGEDVGFFLDAKDAGFQCWMDPEITLGHVGKEIFKVSLTDYVEQNGNSLAVRQ